MKIKLLDFRELTDFPSGSGLEFFEEKIYLVGDDAKDILIMDKKWKKLDGITLFESEEVRIPKKNKADLEATTIIEINKIPRLLILGSGSKKENRSKVFLLNLDDNSVEEIDITPFYHRLKEALGHVNIESASVILGKLVLGNRGLKDSPDNHLIVTDIDFWKHQEEVEFNLVKFDLPGGIKKVAGISGMTYSYKNDWLITTLSTEDDSGKNPIGDSYIGIVEDAAWKILRKKIKVSEVINLPEAHEGFKGYKIESACIQTDKSGRIKMHLVADNDTGVSYMFKARLKE